MAFTLPVLAYDYAALEPHIDARTMEIHHSKHHQAYINNLNAAVAGTEWENKSLEELMANMSKLSPAIRNNGGGHYNHSLFWEVIGPNKGGTPTGALAAAIDTHLGGFEKFKEENPSASPHGDCTGCNMWRSWFVRVHELRNYISACCKAKKSGRLNWRRGWVFRWFCKGYFAI